MSDESTVNFFLLFYECILWMIAFLALPKALYQLIVRKKYRHSLLPRLGFLSQSIKQNQQPAIWIHAVSVGETKAVTALARALKQRFPHYSLIVSSVTETGHAEALRSLPFADHHIYLPYDFHHLMKKALRQAKPKLVVLCESDFWLNFLNCAKKQGAAVVLVNGKLSERSMRRFQKVPFFSTRLFNLFDLLCVQNPLYQMRLETAGAPSQQLVVTGNLKLDEDYPHLDEEEAQNWRKKLGIACSRLVVTIGSTHDPEEEELVKILEKIWEIVPHLLVILVPRHPERFTEVAKILERHDISFVNYTQLSQAQGNHRVILIDVMGMLRLCYQLADIAIVGGSFTNKVGGHNILEPCWYGKPVLFGPYMHSQLELVELMKRYHAGQQTSLDQLQEILMQWLLDEKQRHLMGERGMELVHDLKGSTQRTLNRLNPLLETFKGLEGYVKDENLINQQSA